MSGFTFMPMRDAAGHLATPRDGTSVTEAGEPASLLDAAAYPLAAECKICGTPIRLERLTQMEWVHDLSRAAR